jgi:hypothetical protein
MSKYMSKKSRGVILSGKKPCGAFHNLAKGFGYKVGVRVLHVPVHWLET